MLREHLGEQRGLGDFRCTKVELARPAARPESTGDAGCRSVFAIGVMLQPSEYLEGVRPGDSSATSLLHVPDPYDVGGNLAVIEAIPSFLF